MVEGMSSLAREITGGSGRNLGDYTIRSELKSLEDEVDKDGHPLHHCHS